TTPTLDFTCMLLSLARALAAAAARRELDRLFHLHAELVGALRLELSLVLEALEALGRDQADRRCIVCPKRVLAGERLGAAPLEVRTPLVERAILVARVVRIGEDLVHDRVARHEHG